MSKSKNKNPNVKCKDIIHIIICLWLVIVKSFLPCRMCVFGLSGFALFHCTLLRLCFFLSLFIIPFSSVRFSSVQFACLSIHLSFWQSSLLCSVLLSILLHVCECAMKKVFVRIMICFFFRFVSLLL